MAAVLRGLPSGDLQKVLADGLAYAPTLEGADLQRTNLHNTYLSPRRREGTLERADFYRAALSGGSLKRARAAGAVFYQARLRGTVLRDADLRGANFFEADVTGANFAGARLANASFAGALGVPAELRRFLNEDQIYTGTEPAPGPAGRGEEQPAVFVSLPSQRTAAQEAVFDRLLTLLRREGLEVQQLPREEYPPSDALGEIHRRLSGCSGVAVLGLRAADHPQDESSAGMTPWTQLEAGMAYGCNLPLLIVREAGVDTGAFDESVAGHGVHLIDLADQWQDAAVASAMRPWLSELSRS
jgi:uncharacterized protein YjbI with pentapeptide repeats